jgi:response regulator RpfG family c-di-GMP phosphodiesterase
MKILYIEDDPHSVRLVTKMLEGTNYYLISAGNALKGLAAIAVERPDLILLDFNLPKVNADAILTMLHAHHPHLKTPIILTTADWENLDIQRLAIERSLPLLPKPLNRVSMLATFDKCMGLVPVTI